MFSRLRLKVCRIFGIDVYLDITWFIIFALITINIASVLHKLNVCILPMPFIYLLAAIFVIVFYITLLIHEFSHSLIAKKLGIPVHQITLFFLGGVAQIEKNPDRSGQEFKITIAGPLASLSIAALFYGLYRLIIAVNFCPKILLLFLLWLAIINFWMFLFNLIPAFPMDGGRILRSTLWYFLKNQVKATKIAVWIGTILGLLIIILSIPVFHNPFLILIGLFIIQLGRTELKGLLLREKLKKITVRMAMSRCDSYDFVPEESILFDYCSPEDDLWTIYEKMLKTKKFIFKVVENNQIIGRIDLLDINDYLKKTS